MGPHGAAREPRGQVVLLLSNPSQLYLHLPSQRRLPGSLLTFHQSDKKRLPLFVCDINVPISFASVALIVLLCKSRHVNVHDNITAPQK